MPVAFSNRETKVFAIGCLDLSSDPGHFHHSTGYVIQSFRSRIHDFVEEGRKGEERGKKRKGSNHLGCHLR